MGKLIQRFFSIEFKTCKQHRRTQLLVTDYLQFIIIKRNEHTIVGSAIVVQVFSFFMY